MKRERTKQVPKSVVYQTVCDSCGRVDGADPRGWHHFSSHHNDWGNDSIDSWETHDACSWACYVAIVRRVVEDYGQRTYPTLEVDDKDLAFLGDMLLQIPPASREGDADAS